MKRIAFTMLMAGVLLGSALPAQAKLGDRGTLVAYSKIAHRAWITLYKRETLGNRTIVASGWMAPSGYWSHEIITGNTYYLRAEVEDGKGKVLYDTTVTYDDKTQSAFTLMQGKGNYYWH